MLLAPSGNIHGAEATWPQWRGPTRDSLLPAQSWPEKLDAERLKQTWRVELGPSYSGPIVSEKVRVRHRNKR